MATWIASHPSHRLPILRRVMGLRAEPGTSGSSEAGSRPGSSPEPTSEMSLQLPSGSSLSSSDPGKHLHPVDLGGRPGPAQVGASARIVLCTERADQAGSPELPAAPYPTSVSESNSPVDFTALTCSDKAERCVSAGEAAERSTERQPSPSAAPDRYLA